MGLCLLVDIVGAQQTPHKSHLCLCFSLRLKHVTKLLVFPLVLTLAILIGTALSQVNLAQAVAVGGAWGLLTLNHLCRETILNNILIIAGILRVLTYSKMCLERNFKYNVSCLYFAWVFTYDALYFYCTTPWWEAPFLWLLIKKTESSLGSLSSFKEQSHQRDASPLKS